MSKIVVKIFRENLVENIYRGDIAIVDSEGRPVYSLGDIEKITYWRSAAKPIQVLPVIYSGAYKKYNFTDQELAILSASHNGEEEHIQLVNSVLAKINLTEKDLQCGICLPAHKPTARNLQKEGIPVGPIYNPCSGKHAAQLTLCQYYGWNITEYYCIEHPVQKMILDIISRLAKYPKDKIYLGIDDCGVPVFGLPIANMAKAYADLSNWESLPENYRGAAEKIFSSMTENPYIVGGTDRFETDLMRVSKGNLLAKSGADGVFCIGIRNEQNRQKPPGMGITIKMESGNMKFLPMVILRILEQLKILSKEKINSLKKYLPADIKNYRNEKVGCFVSDFKLNKI